MFEQPDGDKPARTAFADGPRLLADIGATHARFALETAPGVLRSVRVLKCDDFSGIVPLLHSYLSLRACCIYWTSQTCLGSTISEACP